MTNHFHPDSLLNYKGSTHVFAICSLAPDLAACAEFFPLYSAAQCTFNFLLFLLLRLIQVYANVESPWRSWDGVNADIALLEKGQKPQDGGGFHAA